jgi:hypothetical protein
MFLSVILSALRLARRRNSIGMRRTRRGSTLSNAVLMAIVLWFSGCDGQVPTTQGPWAKGYSADQISPSVRAATSGDLLYVSSDAPYVYIYTYPGLAYVSKLDILGGNSGLCDDAAGDVFVTIYSDYQILEYAHGGSQPIQTLSDPNARPLGCAIDSTTGNLAVTSYAGQRPGKHGSVAIYTNASGNPQVYTDAEIFYYDFCTYDGNGNLFIDGQDADLNPVIAELPKGNAKFINLTLTDLPKNFGYPAGIAWDGQDLVLGDLDHPNLYRLQLSGSSLKVVGSTKLRTGKNVEQFTIAADTSGETLIGPNSTAQSVYFWRYPRGGKPMQQITGLSGAFGTAISKGSPQATSTRAR